ncbi:hypothetical protein NG895_01090 [Aeoliella sp. ICT_H6.2]|uniref:Uncharacterized protein n=1 Tax=Aeoliella straminimaris TaxID=2954799 RepID=A0A9X2JEC8_9BACT|nr:hypothetical protein [Aeoliella straminimaris]MCO6042491.1 hypothetical protein [Aeoliella straminimaris]
MQARAEVWLPRIYPHNPLYLVSATFVLYGIHLASQGPYPQANDLKTSLLFAYVIMLAGAGWLVVRFGRVWEDARTILLVVLLMFTAISTSYDRLCLDNPAEGAVRLALAMGFCCVVVESVLAMLRIRLPLAYRLPFYVQLALLFAFPAVLGKLSIDGREASMCLGVLLFSVAAGASLLLLLPTIGSPRLRHFDSGTPWPWPYYPWSIFVFMALAMGVRLWMLSVSFTDAKGLSPAFHPYFLVPLLLAIAVLLLQFGLTHKSKTLQRIALGSLLGIVALSFPLHVSRAQALSLDLLEQTLAAPPLLTTIAATLVAAYAWLRGASWAKSVTLASVLLLSCLDPHTRLFTQLHMPDTWLLAVLLVWLVMRGVWQRDMLNLSAGAAVGLMLARYQFGQTWVSENNAWMAIAAWTAWTLLLPLVCRDRLAQLLRVFAPVLLVVLGAAVAFAFPPSWWEVPEWQVMLALAVLAATSIAYGLHQQIRWHLVPIGFLTAMLIGRGLSQFVQEIGDAATRRGLAWYGVGVGVLLLAQLVSLWKAGLVRRVVDWLLHRMPPENVEAHNAEG